MIWTEKQVDKLKQLVDEECTAPKIAAELGVTRNAVIGKIHRLGYRKGRFNRFTATPKRARIRMYRTYCVQLPALPDIPALTYWELLPENKLNGCCTLEDLSLTTCRWPLWGEETVERHYCGKITIPGNSYCQDHYRTAHRNWISKPEPAAVLTAVSTPTNSP